MDSTPNSSSPDNNAGPKKIAGIVSIDLPWIFGRIQEVMLNPTGCWDLIKSEALSAKEIFGRYLIPLALISAVCGFIGQVFIGINLGLGTYRQEFFPGLLFHTVSLGASLASFFVSAFIIEKLAPKFETEVSRDQALRLVGFAATPGLLAGILGIAPSFLLSLVAFLLSIYSVYLLWSGFETMTKVAPTRKVPYFITAIVCSFVAMLVILGVVSTIFAPAMPNNIQDMQEFQKNIEKLIPSNQR